MLGDNAIDNASPHRPLRDRARHRRPARHPGFLDDFDAFVYTRNGFGSFRASRAAAAATVKAYVKRAVLLNGDFADAVNGDAEIRSSS